MTHKGRENEESLIQCPSNCARETWNETDDKSKKKYEGKDGAKNKWKLFFFFFHSNELEESFKAKFVCFSVWFSTTVTKLTIGKK